MQQKNLEEVLVERGILTQEQLDSAKKEAEETGKSLKDVLIDSGFISKEHMPLLLSIELGVKTVDLANVIVEPEVANLIPESVVRKFKVLPLFREGNNLTVAMADPTDIRIIDELHRETGLMIEPVLASEMEIVRAIDQTYGAADTIYEIVKSIDEKRILSAKDAGEEAPIVKLTNLIIVQAIRDRASDIHIEPEEKMVRVRYRIDGVLHRVVSLPKKSSIMIGIENLGFSKQDLRTFLDLIHKPYGMILVTGPTGSGKTTTLYSALNRLNTEDRNIMTMEDPIEYQLPIVRQTQVNPQIGLTFAAGLRAILRQDPDIVMVGEVRDLETAEIAVHAALTGHLVFSTLHTNDAPSAFTRLVDMGVEPFLVSSSVIGVIAQRLVRVICEKCKESYEPTPAVLKELGLPEAEKLKLHRGKGCPLCKGTGYRGRIGIYSVLKVTPKIQELIVSRAPAGEIDKVARSEGMKTLREDCLDKVVNGITTVEEMLRVTQDIIV
ncbi:MAG: hypothetical protein B6D53_03725 [Candidatus Omnitrophica bacterium 4484_49]|nr:MAG: hypothetical protein B6D53_03725 [Candidatus Omnitrophica bacterium 4484_49]